MAATGIDIRNTQYFFVTNVKISIVKPYGLEVFILNVMTAAY